MIFFAYMLITPNITISPAPVVTSSTANPKPLRYQDVLILTENDSLQDASPPEDADPSHPATASGIVRGLRQAGVPVQVVKKGDVTAAKELAVKSGLSLLVKEDRVWFCLL